MPIVTLAAVDPSPRVSAGDAADPPDARYQRAIARLRRERPDEAFAAYIDADTAAAARRFSASEEFETTYRLLRSNGLPRRGSVLDVGAGNGVASFALAARGHVVCAVEPCQGADYGTAAIDRVCLAAGLRVGVVTGVGEHLPFARDSFDAVYLRQCLHHARDLVRMTAEAARVLRPGGVFLAVREHVVSDEGQLREFLVGSLMCQFGGEERAYRLADYLAALRRAGLRLERVVGPYDSIINLYPDSPEAARSRAERRVAAVLGSDAARRLSSTSLFRATVPKVLNRAKRRPGRMYSFLARRPARSSRTPRRA